MRYVQDQSVWVVRASSNLEENHQPPSPVRDYQVQYVGVWELPANRKIISNLPAIIVEQLLLM